MISRLDRRGDDAGFTLVEMVVALCLFALAIAVALPALGNMLDIGNRGQANVQSSYDSSYAVQLVEADLRRAQANRGNNAFAEDVSAVDAELSSSNPTRHDIIAAGPTRLELWSDALGSSAGPERVIYELREELTRRSGNPCERKARTSWCIIRTVVGGGRTISEVVAHGAGRFPQDSSCIPPPPGSTNPPAPRTRLFCYQHKVPATPGPLASRYAWASWTPTCMASWGTPPSPSGDWNGSEVRFAASSPVATFHDRLGGTRIWPLDTISAIGIVTPAGARTDGARSVTTRVTTVDLRNRASEEYLSAIMCGDR